MSERKIVEYYILHDQDRECLGEHVEYFISRGWQPYGFPTLKDSCSYQPMVKYDSTETEPKED